MLKNPGPHSYVSTLAAVVLGTSLLTLAGCGESGGTAKVQQASSRTAEPLTPPPAPSAEPAAVETAEEIPAAVAPVGDLSASRAAATDEMPDDLRTNLSATSDTAEGLKDGRPERQPPSPPVDPETYPIKAEPSPLDLGQIAVNETGKGTVKLRNTGEESILLNQCKTSCGCTTANCPKGQHIAPGESVDVEVSLKGGATARPIKKTVTFVFNEDDKLLVDVVGEAVAYVSIDPLYIVPERLPDGKVVIKSEDGQSFHIKSMTPAIIETFGEEALTEHVVNLDWERWKELGSQTKVTFFLDHPKAESIGATVRPQKARKDPVAQADQPVDTASLPMVAMERVIKEGNVSAVLEKLEKGDVKLDSTDRTGQTLLHLAAKAGQAELIKALLERGADVNATDTVGRTALMTAAQAKNPATIRALLEGGASLEPRDLVGSALSWSAAFGDAESTQTLIDKGAELEVAGTATGFTPLIWAAGFGDGGSVRALIAAGANLESRDLTHGCTPLMHASRTGGVEKIGILLAAGAQLEARDNTGKTPLLVAAEGSGASVENLQALLDAGADLTATDNRGKTALDLANTRTDARGDAVREFLRKIMEKEEPAPAPAPGGEGG